MPDSPVPGPEMKLDVRYQGLVADTGRMKAVDVGPAIFGVGKAVGDAARVLYGDDQRIQVDVRADFEHASFGIEFIALATPGGLLSHVSLGQIADVLGILGFVGVPGGVVWLIKWLKGRRITSAERIGDTYQITTDDHSTTNINYNVYNVFADPGVREGLQAVTEPLSREGVDRLQISSGTGDPVIIEKDEKQYFKAVSLPEEEISVDVGPATLEVVSPVFRDDNSWRFAQSGVSFWAKIADQEFLLRVARHRTLFGRGDALRVEMETRTTRTGADLSYVRTILQVHEHLPGPGGDQLSLASEE